MRNTRSQPCTHLIWWWNGWVTPPDGGLEPTTSCRSTERGWAEDSWAELSSYLLPARIVTHLSREFNWKATRVHSVQPHVHSSVIATGTRFILNPIFSICTCTITVHTWTNTNGTADLHYYNHSHVKSTQRRPHNNHSPLIVSVHIHSSSPAFRFLYLNKRLTPLFPVTFTDLESDWRNW